MLKFDTPMETQFQQFWLWWSGELLSLVPVWLQKILGGGNEYLVVTREEAGLRLIHMTSQNEITIDVLPFGNSGAAHREAFVREYPKLAELKTLLRLSHGQGLRKQIKLPAAAEENLNQVMSFEMDRMTPFKSDQVYFSTVIRNRLKNTRQIVVDLILTPRSKLDGLLDELSALGWRPDLVSLEGEQKPGTYSLLPEKYAPPRNRWPDMINLALLITISSLIGFLIVLPIWSAHAESARLQTEVKRVAKIAKDVESMREESDKLLHQARFLQDKKHSEPVLTDMLEELSKVIPDGTWLNGLQFTNRRVTIQGQSPSASSLIQRIEASPYFRNVSFVSPVTKDTSNGLERFQIAGDVVNGRFSEKPQ